MRRASATRSISPALLLELELILISGTLCSSVALLSTQGQRSILAAQVRRTAAHLGCFYKPKIRQIIVLQITRNSVDEMAYLDVSEVCNDNFNRRILLSACS